MSSSKILGLNKSIYKERPKLSSGKQVLKPRYKQNSQKRYELILKCLDIGEKEKKMGKAFGESKAKLTDFLELQFCGEDETLVIKSVAWGRYVSTCLRLFTVGCVFKINFQPTEAFADFEASTVPYCISLSGKKSKVANAGEIRPGKELTTPPAPKKSRKGSKKMEKPKVPEIDADGDEELMDVQTNYPGARKESGASSKSKKDESSSESDSSESDSEKEKSSSSSSSDQEPEAE
uniref:Uncharacterized protein n=1 Tax=Panagrolaimus sp. PS1159 TaxID=55785 RepID=A0AC35FK64_9BILA